jgi:hypothetical protein
LHRATAASVKAPRHVVRAVMEGTIMTNKPLITGLASIAAMAAVLWSMPAAADMGSAASSSVY